MAGPNAFFGCLIWLPLMFWVLSLVHWMIMGDIDGLTGTTGILIGFGLGIVALVPPVAILSPLSFVVVIATMVLYPFVKSALNQVELRSVDVEALQRTYDVLGQRPQNPSARFRLAQYLWKLGNPGHALAIAEEAVKQMPVQHFRDEHRILAAWKQNPLPPDVQRAIACPSCGFANPPGEIFCQGCGAPFLLHRLDRRLGPGTAGRRMIAAWITMVAVLIGIPATSALPPLLTIVSIVALLIFVGVVLGLAFRPALKEKH